MRNLDLNVSPRANSTLIKKNRSIKMYELPTAKLKTDYSQSN